MKWLAYPEFHHIQFNGTRYGSFPLATLIKIAPLA
jgi:hypothetical protein